MMQLSFLDALKEYEPQKSPFGEDEILHEHYLLIGTGNGFYFSQPRDPDKVLSDKQKEHLRNSIAGEKLIWLYETSQCSEWLAEHVETKLRDAS